MIKVFTSSNMMEVEVVRGELESRGVTTMINNEFIRGQSNMVGFGEIWPTLWVVNEAEAPAARRIIASRNEALANADWICPECGEEVEGQFDSCWNCGHARTT